MSGCRFFMVTTEWQVVIAFTSVQENRCAAHKMGQTSKNWCIYVCIYALRAHYLAHYNIYFESLNNNKLWQSCMEVSG